MLCDILVKILTWQQLTPLENLVIFFLFVPAFIFSHMLVLTHAFENNSFTEAVKERALVKLSLYIFIAGCAHMLVIVFGFLVYIVFLYHLFTAPKKAFSIFNESIQLWRKHPIVSFGVIICGIATFPIIYAIVLIQGEKPT